MTELLNCPFCGGKPEFNDYGTCISLLCEDCNMGFDWQVCDVVDNWTQYEFIQTKEYTGYEQKAVDLTHAALAEAWNTRATTREKALKGQSLRNAAALAAIPHCLSMVYAAEHALTEAQAMEYAFEIADEFIKQSELDNG